MLHCKVKAVITIVTRWGKEDYGIGSKGNDVGNGKNGWRLVMAMFYVFSCPGSSIPDLGQSLSESVTDCHFRILTQSVTFETSDPSDI